MRFQPALYLKFWLSVPIVLSIVQGIDLSSTPHRGRARTQKVESISVPGMKAFPESITSTSDGALFVGRVGDGGIVRIKPSTAESAVFVRPDASGSRSILGVFADEASSTLWACSNDLSALGGPASGSDTGSALKGFDLKTGAGKRSVSLPSSYAFCNDITVDGKGVVVQGGEFAVTSVHSGFATPTSVTRIGMTAWVSEGQLSFFFDPPKKNLSPSLPFRIYGSIEKGRH